MHTDNVPDLRLGDQRNSSTDKRLYPRLNDNENNQGNWKSEVNEL
jgi:hypothetical protein